MNSGASSVPLTPNQIRGFWASWGGWTLDGMDSFIYALVLVPSLRELLPRSGIAATKGNIGLYGGLLFALFLIGWGLAFLWGPVGDKIGRVRTLMLTILWYSVFTFLSALVTSVWQLAVLRLLAGIGIGGEWAMGGTFVAEEWPENRRRVGAGLMHTGYYVGIFLAALVNYGIGSHFGWRAMFAVGGLPALLLAWIRRGVEEPERWKRKEVVVRAWSWFRPLATLFSPVWRRRTILNSLFMLASICGLWAGTVYVPAAITALAEAAGHAGAQATQLASWGTMLVAFATILGCLAMPWLAERLGRRGALALFFSLMMAFIAVTFGKVFYLGAAGLPWFFICLFFSWPRRREFFRVHPVAARAISHGVPRQRIRFLHLVRPLRRGCDHVPSRRGCPAFRIAGNSSGADFHSFCYRPVADPMGRRNPRTGATLLAARLSAPAGEV
jgi:MFS family permease